MDPIAIFIRNMVFPFMERFRGNRIREYMKELDLTQYLEPEEIFSLQRQKLKKLLFHCLDNVEFYKGFSRLRKLVEKDPFAALKELPVLEKKTLRQESARFISDGLDKNTLILNRTGGSTGEPLEFYMDRKTVEYYEAARWRGLSWWGIRPGDKCAMFWGSPVEFKNYNRFIFRVKERLLKNRIMFPSFNIRRENMGQNINLLNRYRPVYLYGYTSALYQFAKYMLEEKVYLDFRPKAVVSTSETLFEEQRKDMSKAFGCDVVNEYGAKDGGILAYQCPYGSMHITSENLVLEVIDLENGSPARPEGTGEVLVTDLNNFSMPRIRYSLGDTVSLGEEKCGCPLGLPVLGNICGRVDELLLSLDGSLVSGHLINSIVRNTKGVNRYRFTQHTPGRATIEIVKNGSYTSEEESFLLGELSNALGGVIVIANYVDGIEPGDSGKRRYIVRRFPIHSDGVE